MFFQRSLIFQFIPLLYRTCRGFMKMEDDQGYVTKSSSSSTSSASSTSTKLLKCFDLKCNVVDDNNDTNEKGSGDASAPTDLPIVYHPRVVIIEQPAQNNSRFRYLSEGKAAGPLYGINSTNTNKTYPTIKLEGFKGKAKVVVSCVEARPPHRVHPNKMVGNGCKNGILVGRFNDNMIFQMKKVGVQCSKRRERQESLMKREEMNIDPFQQGFDHANLKDIDISVVRLCFQVYIYTSEDRVIALKPVLSDEIMDKKIAMEIRIEKVSDRTSPVEGGKDILVLCSKVQKDDLKIIFRTGSGEEFEPDYKQVMVHMGCGILFKTPKFPSQTIAEPVKVELVLHKISLKTDSPPEDFWYIPKGYKGSISGLNTDLNYNSDIDAPQKKIDVDDDDGGITKRRKTKEKKSIKKDLEEEKEETEEDFSVCNASSSPLPSMVDLPSMPPLIPIPSKSKDYKQIKSHEDEDDDFSCSQSDNLVIDLGDTDANEIAITESIVDEQEQKTENCQQSIENKSYSVQMEESVNLNDIIIIDGKRYQVVGKPDLNGMSNQRLATPLQYHNRSNPYLIHGDSNLYTYNVVLEKQKDLEYFRRQNQIMKELHQPVEESITLYGVSDGQNTTIDGQLFKTSQFSNPPSSSNTRFQQSFTPQVQFNPRNVLQDNCHGIQWRNSQYQPQHEILQKKILLEQKLKYKNEFEKSQGLLTHSSYQTKLGPWAHHIGNQTFSNFPQRSQMQDSEMDRLKRIQLLSQIAANQTGQRQNKQYSYLLSDNQMVQAKQAEVVTLELQLPPEYLRNNQPIQITISQEKADTHSISESNLQQLETNDTSNHQLPEILTLELETNSNKYQQIQEKDIQYLKPILSSNVTMLKTFGHQQNSFDTNSSQTINEQNLNTNNIELKTQDRKMKTKKERNKTTKASRVPSREKPMLLKKKLEALKETLSHNSDTTFLRDILQNDCQVISRGSNLGQYSSTGIVTEINRLETRAECKLKSSFESPTKYPHLKSFRKRQINLTQIGDADISQPLSVISKSNQKMSRPEDSTTERKEK